MIIMKSIATKLLSIVFGALMLLCAAAADEINLRGVARNLREGVKEVDCDCTKYCPEGFNESCGCWTARDTSTTPPTDLDLIDATCYCNDELQAAGTCQKTFESYNTNQLCLQKGKPKTYVAFIQNRFIWYDCQVEGDNEGS